MQTSTPPSLDDLTKDELLKHFKAARIRNDALTFLLQNVTNDFRSSLSMIIGYSILFLEEPELIGPPLNKDQTEGMEIIKRSAEGIDASIEHIYHNLWAIDSLAQTSNLTKLTLAEIDDIPGIAVETDFNQSSSALSNKRDLEAIIHLLDFQMVRNTEVIKVEIVEATNDLFRFILPTLTSYAFYYVERIIDKETGRLIFPETERYRDPFGLAIALVEKHGGTVYAELGNDSTYSLSFTLPVYREAA